MYLKFKGTETSSKKPLKKLKFPKKRSVRA